ncbi:hypothetical protein WN944_001133 [Citrus x changshan-huyou]|uniref:Beta-galactosidase n=1 Tax=Citrus x changshan-huyou TaxID=2935761 RepID=A0AAP0MGR0_9ROSI
MYRKMLSPAAAKVFALLLLFISSWEICSVKSTVTYDRKGLIINGQRRILFSGSIHYPRSTPEMWPDLLKKAKDGGLDIVDTYVFWNGHEPTRGKFYFEGRYDLVRFIKLAQQAGLYVTLRIGPYACAEWNFGAFPAWLKFIPGMEFRIDNQPFELEMQKWVTKIVDMLKAEKLFETQGGPIILSQIENEFELVEWNLGDRARVYGQWAAHMAIGLNITVPWIMCKQANAPDPIIDTCNDFYCDWFSPNKDYKPKMWTENWTAWVQQFGTPPLYRPHEDLAYSVLKFIQTGGSMNNYYMYHGGTNFDRTNGAFVTTSYDYDGVIDEYGLPSEPKWGHLSELHKVIKTCEPTILNSEPTVIPLGPHQEARVFNPPTGGCVAFLSNHDPNLPVNLTFGNLQYELPPWSISVLPDCRTAVYNSAIVTARKTEKKMIPFQGALQNWESYSEGTPSSDSSKTFVKYGLTEHLFLTRDTTDYLWYTTEVFIDPSEGFLYNGQDPLLNIMSAGHGLNVYVNDQLQGLHHGSLETPQVTFSKKVKLRGGVNKISLQSVAVGLPNIGTQFEKWNLGVLGPVTLSGLNEGTRDLAKQNWTYKIGLEGEDLGLPFSGGNSSVQWVQGPTLAKNWPGTWYKTTFDAPEGNDPLALDMRTMSKGLIWVNGHGVGRYWSASTAYGNCSPHPCYYGGYMNNQKCLSGCGKPSQIWYHVPRSWLKPTGNLLVVFEEWGGDPTGISLLRRTI